MAVIDQINNLPNSLNIKSSPRILFTGTKMDISENPLTFGTPAMFHVVTAQRGITVRRADLGIYLRSNPTTKGSHRVWLKATNRIATRKEYTVIKYCPTDLEFPIKDSAVPSSLPKFIQILD
jgi:hypothetical protein